MGTPGHGDPHQPHRLTSGGTAAGPMKRGTARLWQEAGRWVIQIELDGGAVL